MELQALLVLCGLGVAGVAVILLMGLFSASGTTYEEAIAQQRKATTELLALAENKGKPKKTNKKANKKLAKKEKKETTTATTGSEPESEAPADSGADDDTQPTPKPHVEFSPPVVVDVPSDAPPNIKIRKRGKDPKVKPILINKEDPSCVSDPSTLPSPTGSTVSNHFEEMQPKDEFELMHSSFIEKASEKKEEAAEKKDKPSKPAKNTKAVSKPAVTPEHVKEEKVQHSQTQPQSNKEQKKGKKAEKKNTSEESTSVVEVVVPPLNAPQPSELTTEKLLKQAVVPVATPPAPSPPGSKNKKKKSEANVLALMAGDSGGVAVSELVRVVKEAALSRNEIQILTDTLLNKQHDTLPEHSEWLGGPNDPMQKLKKQLAEKEKALADEVEASQALHAKLKELRATLNAERGRAAAASRSAEQAAGAARAELHTLQTRLQRVLDDNHALNQEKSLLQSQLSAQGEAQAQRVQMEMHIQRLSESEAALLQQLSALQAEMSTLAREAGQAQCDAAAARDSMIIAQRHNEELAQQFQEANRACAELEKQRQRAVHAEKIAQQDLHEAQERLAGLAELQNEVKRLASRAQVAERNAENLKDEAKLAKESAAIAKEEAEKAKQYAEKIKAEMNRVEEDAQKLRQEIVNIKEQSENEKTQMSNKLTSMKEVIMGLESELAELKQMNAVPAQNGLPSVYDDEKRASELAKVESIVEALKEELTVAQKGSTELKDQVATLKQQLQQYQEKNNELRTKNWKVMEALQSAEKALQAKSTSAMPAQDSLSEAIVKAQESQYNEVVNVLRSACPSVAPSSGNGKDWLHTFANNLKNEFQKMELERKNLEIRQQELEKKSVAEPQTTSSRLTQTLAQSEPLQIVVDQYKRAFEDTTEDTLSRLQQKVTLAEERWSKQLAEKQRELDELRQRTVSQMQKKIEFLEAELQNAQKSNHSHSFADTERLTEEKLMGSLAEKQDLCNGPLLQQATVEEQQL